MKLRAATGEYGEIRHYADPVNDPGPRRWADVREVDSGLLVRVGLEDDVVDTFTRPGESSWPDEDELEEWLMERGYGRR